MLPEPEPVVEVLDRVLHKGAVLRGEIVISMMQIEDLGFCGKGEGPDFIRGKDITTKGDFPHNTSGGQLSGGQAGAAGGFIGLVEAIRQVLGEAGGTQVAGAKRALVSGFGMINYDRGVCSAAAMVEAA